MKVEAEITLYCENCGKELGVSQDRQDKITVEPCVTCKKEHGQEKYDEGYRDAKDEMDF